MRRIPYGLDFVDFIKAYEGTIVLVMHTQADLDAVGSAIAMIHFITQLNQNLSIRVFDPNLSQLGQELAEKSTYKFKKVKIDYIHSPVTFILLDTNQINSELYSANYQYIIFDHHITTSLNIPLVFDFRLPSFLATTEIISCLFHQTKMSLTPEIIRCLLAGILFDTKRFLYADLELFECIIYLLSSDSKIYDEVNMLFSSLRSYSERTACIKAAQRMKKHLIGNKVLLLSYVSSYEASAARALISLGGDVAIVIAKRKSETRISLRATPEFISETGVSLGKDIVPALITQFGGTGGGHDAAAGYNAGLLEINSVKNFLCNFIDKKVNDNHLF
ncbi:MAG: bifunctional oligoribonuclease/PAP phosphatase NrnA [Candidatus Hodarchaeota archaeon]